MIGGVCLCLICSSIILYLSSMTYSWPCGYSVFWISWCKQTKTHNCRGSLCWHNTNRSNIYEPTRACIRSWRSDTSHICFFFWGRGGRDPERTTAARQKRSSEEDVWEIQSQSEEQRGEKVALQRIIWGVLADISVFVLCQIVWQEYRESGHSPPLLHLFCNKVPCNKRTENGDINEVWYFCLMTEGETFMPDEDFMVDTTAQL